MLRNGSAPLSGELISRELDVSRVAVWKQIKALKELGYAIESTPRGYVLNEESDHLFSWEFPDSKNNYQAYRELDSTMDKAREEAVKGCDPYTTILAETQRKGRGRGERSWISGSGGLYFTLVLKPRLPLAYHYVYTLGASAALSEAARELYGADLSTKWPNDVLWGDRKIAGFLTEMQVSGDSISWLTLGAGINVNNDPRLESGTSLEKIMGRKLDRKDLLECFVNKFRSLMEKDSPAEIRSLWEKRSAMIGSEASFEKSDGQIIRGVVRSVDQAGSLLVEKDSKLKQVLFGDLYKKNRGE